MISMIILSIDDSEKQQFMEAFYERYRKLVIHVSKKWIDNPEEQRDVVQETWVKLVRKREVLASLGEAKQVSYVAYCARNTALKRLSEMKDEQRKLVDWETVSSEDIFLGAIQSTEETVLQKEWEEAFRKIWVTLPQRDRLLLEGKYLFKESDEELAEWLGCKPGSVRMALTRARRTAMNELKRRKDDEQSGTTAGAV